MIRQMVKIGLVVLILGVVTVDWAQSSDEEKIAAQAEKKRQMIKAAKKKLDNTTWQIELTQMTTGKKKVKTEDTLRFINGRIESEQLVSEGFSASNFTVRIKREDTVIWETMQSSEEQGLAFWRGEIKEGIMRGVLSRHLDEKTIKDYTFVSEKKEIILIPEEGKKEKVVPVVVEEIEKPEEAPAAEVIKETLEEEPAEVKTEQVKEEEEEPGGEKAVEEKKEKKWPWQR